MTEDVRIKVGIITTYYKSTNYGGLLQAFALCRYINSLPNVEAEQISYYSNSTAIGVKSIEKFKSASITLKAKIVIKRFKLYLSRVNTYIIAKNAIKKRRTSLESFRENIPHTECVYNDETISQISLNYDVYVAGSDRIWNPKRVGNPFYLTFVRDRLKISFAASVSSVRLSESEKEAFSKILDDFDAISVRERETVDLLQPLTTKHINWAVDPTFLLDKSVWEQVSDDRIIDEDYIFCYFLGADKINRKLAQDYAKEKKIKIITIPFANDVGHYCDLNFGDIRLNECSPSLFVSLIKHAEYIFTDSFHATVFSTIFNKEVFSLERDELKGTGTRLKSLTELLGTSDHYCIVKEQLSTKYLLRLNRIDYSVCLRQLNNLIAKSKEFLDNSIRLEEYQNG